MLHVLLTNEILTFYFINYFHSLGQKTVAKKNILLKLSFWTAVRSAVTCRLKLTKKHNVVAHKSRYNINLTAFSNRNKTLFYFSYIERVSLVKSISIHLTNSNHLTESIHFPQ